MPSAHGVIIELAKKLGYLEDVSPSGDGLCQGIAVSWMNARLIGQGHVFEKRMNFIMAEGAESVASQIERIRETIRAEGSRDLSDQEKDIIEVLGLYDSIFLHQSPAGFSDLFNTKLEQDHIKTISSFSASKQLEDDGGLHQIYSQIIVSASSVSMADYFEKIAIKIKGIQPPVEGQVGFILGSSVHAISLEYNVKEDTWTYMDINVWPPKSTKSTDELAHCIRDFSGSTFSNSSNVSCFNLQMFSTEKDANRLTSEFSGFRAENKLSDLNAEEIDGAAMNLIVQVDPGAAFELARSDKALKLFTAQSEINGLTAMHVAVIQGNAALIKAVTELLGAHDIKRLMTQQNRLNTSVVSTATQFGQHNIIKLMGELPGGLELLREKNQMGQTVAYAAAQFGNASIIQVIGELPGGLELLREKNQTGQTVAHVSAQSGNASIIQVIGELPGGLALLREKDPRGNSVAYIAAMRAQASVIKTIGELPGGLELLRESHQGNASAAHIAALRGHGSVIAVIAELSKGFELLCEQDRFGNTPAHVAFEAGNFAVIQVIAELPDGNGLKLLSKVNHAGQSVLQLLTRLQKENKKNDVNSIVNTITATIDLKSSLRTIKALDDTLEPQSPRTPGH